MRIKILQAILTRFIIDLKQKSIDLFFDQCCVANLKKIHTMRMTSSFIKEANGQPKYRIEQVC